MNFLKTRFYSFVDDKLQRFSLIFFILGFLLSIFNNHEFHSIEWKLRIVIYGAGIFLTFFWGNRGTWITFFLIAYIVFYFSTFKNVTYFTFVTILILFYPKFRYPMLILYLINIVIISHLHNLEIMKICYHLLICSFIYFSINEFSKRIKNVFSKELKLTEDEKIILNYLSKGIQQNDIPDFSSVTVSRKLRAAKIRNGIGSTKELIERFRLNGK